jgi:guanosine-3',5'-bis(diphosphate) 3'-pyrophosphohydrolase
MTDAVGNNSTLLLNAASFAADRHRKQRRKGEDASPYINHPLDVANILAGIGGVTDTTILVAAVLHDTIEDTSATSEELEDTFGREVRLLVEEVSDDKSLDKAERKRRQIEHAAALSTAAKVIKFGDKICNVRDVRENPPSDWSLQRRCEYLDWSGLVMKECRGVNESLEDHFDEILREGRAALTRAVKVTLRRAGETKNKVRYEEPESDQPTVIGTLRVPKWAVHCLEDPETITVTIEGADR